MPVTVDDDYDGEWRPCSRIVIIVYWLLQVIGQTQDIVIAFQGLWYSITMQSEKSSCCCCFSMGGSMWFGGSRCEPSTSCTSVEPIHALTNRIRSETRLQPPQNSGPTQMPISVLFSGESDRSPIHLLGSSVRGEDPRTSWADPGRPVQSGVSVVGDRRPVTGTEQHSYFA